VPTNDRATRDTLGPRLSEHQFAALTLLRAARQRAKERGIDDGSYMTWVVLSLTDANNRLFKVCSTADTNLTITNSTVGNPPSYDAWMRWDAGQPVLVGGTGTTYTIQGTYNVPDPNVWSVGDADLMVEAFPSQGGRVVSCPAEKCPPNGNPQGWRSLFPHLVFPNPLPSGGYSIMAVMFMRNGTNKVEIRSDPLRFPRR
jgi:hypothetical protein